MKTIIEFKQECFIKETNEAFIFDMKIQGYNGDDLFYKNSYPYFKDALTHAYDMYLERNAINSSAKKRWNMLLLNGNTEMDLLKQKNLSGRDALCIKAYNK